MTRAEELQDEVDRATGALLLELAWLLPRGTDLRTHPIGQVLRDYKGAIEARCAMGVSPGSGARVGTVTCVLTSGRRIDLTGLTAKEAIDTLRASGVSLRDIVRTEHQVVGVALPTPQKEGE